AVFGYLSTSKVGNLTVPIGTSNRIVPSPDSRGQPQVFIPGRHEAQFAVEVNGRSLAWELDGKVATANVLLPTCTPACVQHLQGSGQPRIDGVLPDPPVRLSAEESLAIRRSFRWSDTLPVPEADAAGDPRIYQGLAYVHSREAGVVMDALRIHYDS